jgi:DNA-binding MarR family transcriptional regulator
MLGGREDMVGGEAVAHLARVLGRADRRLAERLAEVLTRDGHTLDQWRVLSVLVDSHGRPRRRSMGEVVEAIGVPGPALTRVVDRMVASDLVDRRTDDGDRRRVLLGITTDGRTLHARLGRLVRAEGAAIEEQVGAAEVAELARLLEHLLTASTLDEGSGSQ